MKERMLFWLLALPLATALVTSLASGQEALADDVDVKIEELRMEDLRWSDKYPDFNLPGVSGKTDRWKMLAVRLTFAATGRDASVWLDEVYCDWKVVLGIGEKGKFNDPVTKNSVVMARVEKVVNIEATKRGNSVWTIMFIPPDTLRRYADNIPTENVFIELAVRVGEKTRAQLVAHGSKLYVTKRDRESSGAATAVKFLGSENTKRLKNDLLSRFESPWFYARRDDPALPRPGIATEK